MDSIIRTFGTPGMIAYKSFALMLIWGLYVECVTRFQDYVPTMVRIIYIACGVFGLLSIHNLLLLTYASLNLQ